MKLCSILRENFHCSETTRVDPLYDTFVQFQSSFAQRIREFPGDRLRSYDLRQIIKSTADSVKEQHRGTPEKSVVRKIVKSLVKDAERSYCEVEVVKKQDALFKHFGGLPEPLVDGFPFLVVRSGPGQTRVFSFGNGFDREYLGKLTPRPIDGIILTQEGRRDVALEDPTMFQTIESKDLQVETEGNDRSPVLEPHAPVLYPVAPSTPTLSKNETLDIDYLGWTLTTERQPFVWGARKCQVTAYLKKELPLKEDDLLAADESKDSPAKTLILKTVTVKTYNKGAAVLTKKIEETINMIELEPIFEISPGYEGEVRPGNIDNYQLRLPNNSELRRALRLPETGLPLGVVETHANPLTYYFPKQPTDLIYQSIFVTGAQGSGKTTFVRLLVRTLTGEEATPPHQRPAVVILDGEGDYLKFQKTVELNSSTKAFLEQNHVGDVKPHLVRVSANSDADRTLSLEGIAPSDLIYLVPELPTKSTEVAAEVIRKCCDNQLEPATVESLKTRVIDEVLRNQQIARVQKSAIIRALEFSSNLRLFDVPGVLPLRGEELLIPGRITVIDVSDLTEDQKRTVALYLLLCFDKSKTNASQTQTGLMFVLDEAHRLFPKKAPSIHKEYIEKVAAKINNIVHRGRKRKYGLILATQSPSDLYPLISDLCNTKVVFHTEGSPIWLGSNLGPAFVKKVRKLGKGECIISLRGSGQGTPPLQIRVPNVSDGGA